MENLPTYKIKVNEDDASGVFAIALVDEPAIEIDFIALSKQIEMEFTANKDKQLLYGPLLIPDKLIFRRDEKGNEFNIVFDAETIALIADKWNENKLNDNFNFQHSNRKVNAIILENWLTGENDKSKDFGYDLPKGTWFSKMKIKDDQFWLNEIKSGKVKGFSIEIKADIELLQLQTNKTNINFMEIKTNEGVSLYYDGDLAVGTAIYLDEAMTEKAPEGAHMLEDQRVITVDGEGIITAIAEETPNLPEEDLSTEENLEETIVEENLALVPEEVMAIVQPVLDSMANQLAELVNKISELEAKMNELEGNTATDMEAFKSEVNEKLSSTPAADSISKKVDTEKAKKDEVLLSKINSFRGLIK